MTDVIRNPLRFCLFVCAVAALSCASLYAQNWPKPASTPNTTVKCDQTLYPDCANQSGKSLAGWDLPVKSYVGRVIDSGGVFPIQYGFRPARGYLFRVTGSRIYENTGSAVLSWDRSNFFSRLQSGQSVPGTSYPAQRNGESEYLLPWDSTFCAEAFSSWQTPVADGDQRL